MRLLIWGLIASQTLLFASMAKSQTIEERLPICIIEAQKTIETAKSLATSLQNTNDKIDFNEIVDLIYRDESSQLLEKAIKIATEQNLLAADLERVIEEVGQSLKLKKTLTLNMVNEDWHSQNLDQRAAYIASCANNFDGIAETQAEQIVALNIKLDNLEKKYSILVEENALLGCLGTNELAQSATSEKERMAALLQTARQQLGDLSSLSLEQAKDLIAAEKETALLNQQVAILRQELQKLQGLLEQSEARDIESQAQLENMGNRLNAALARVASEERKNRKLEEAERLRLQQERDRLRLQQEPNSLVNQATELAKYQSEFFGRMREILAGQGGVQILGDRFVISSEVLFDPGQATLQDMGMVEIEQVSTIIKSVVNDIPDGLDWVLRVDGHTDNIPLSGTGEFRDNWELSQARALSVVRYMVDDLGMPADRIAANGFGEYQPISTENTAQARARNRRIEIKITEK